MRQRLGLLLWCALAWPTPVMAQFTITPTSFIAWDQPAGTLADVTASKFELQIDPAGGPVTLLAGVTCTGVASPFPCSAPVPVAAVGTHTLQVIAIDPAGNRSPPSTAITVTPEVIGPPPPPPPPDQTCVFPTGANAISIFPTRLLHGGQRTTVQFQLASAGSPVNQIFVFLELGGVVNPTPVKTVGSAGSTVDLTDVGSVWFFRPTVPGTYTIHLAAKNIAGCSATVNTKYTFITK